MPFWFALQSRLIDEVRVKKVSALTGPAIHATWGRMSIRRSEVRSRLRW